MSGRGSAGPSAPGRAATRTASRRRSSSRVGCTAATATRCSPSGSQRWPSTSPSPAVSATGSGRSAPGAGSAGTSTTNSCCGTVAEEPDAVAAVPEGRDVPRRLGAGVLAGDVAALLGHPRQVGDARAVGREARLRDAERRVGQPHGLAAGRLDDVELRLALRLGAQEGDPPTVRRVRRRGVAVTAGEADRLGRAVGREAPELAGVLVDRRVGRRHRDDDRRPVRAEGGGTGGAQERDISRDHPNNLGARRGGFDPAPAVDRRPSAGPSRPTVVGRPDIGAVTGAGGTVGGQR